MNRLVAMVIVLCAATPALGWPSPFAPQQPHPAVVRVIATEKDGLSLGSGSLIAVNDTHGMVVTNWHVVRDATGPVTVVFPDGFRCGALVLRVDRDWDLAALAIRRPNVQPIRLSAQAPRPGETLTIAGYGSGSYRAVAGRCREYVSPGARLPYEMVEVEAAARQGDSGGPILNQRGELAGVLFGTGFGRTAGSYCGRVQTFLATTAADFARLSPPAYMAQPQTAAAVTATASPAVASNMAGNVAASPRAAVPPAAPSSVEPCTGGVCVVGGVRSSVPPAATATPYPPPPRVAASPPAQPPVASAPVASVSPLTASPANPLPPTRGEVIKTILAAIGALALLFHGIRLVGASVG